MIVLSPQTTKRRRWNCSLCGRVPGPKAKHELTKNHERKLLAHIKRTVRQREKTAKDEKVWQRVREMFATLDEADAKAIVSFPRVRRD